MNHYQALSSWWSSFTMISNTLSSVLETDCIGDMWGSGIHIWKKQTCESKGDKQWYQGVDSETLAPLLVIPNKFTI